MSDPSETPLFGDLPKDWEEHWKDLPAFVQRDMRPSSSITVYFRNEEDRRKFLTLLDEVPSRQKSIWYPKLEYPKQPRPGEVSVGPSRYPIYVISKGRWEARPTSIALERLGIPYRIVVEPVEFDKYASVISSDKILVLPFSNLGQGSIPARNWVWDHAVASGNERHWILDDNIYGFAELNNNARTNITDFNPFCRVEQFVDRYSNVALAGMQYRGFPRHLIAHPPFVLNTRIYSCILIKNDLPYRWRGRYNEDTDLSLRVLKDGWCTVLFYSFVIDKKTTMTMSGGNTDELYKDDGRLKMALALQELHPDVVEVGERWGRSQHIVNYEPFRRNKLIKRS